MFAELDARLFELGVCRFSSSQRARLALRLFAAGMVPDDLDRLGRGGLLLWRLRRRLGLAPPPRPLDWRACLLLRLRSQVLAFALRPCEVESARA